MRNSCLLWADREDSQRKVFQMIIILKNDPDPWQLEDLTGWLRDLGLTVCPTVGVGQTILGLVGDTSRVDADLIAALDIVEDVKRVQEPFKNVNRKFHPENTVVSVGQAVFGDGSLTLIAGPCAVENEEQILSAAYAVKNAGAQILRAGAFRSRTSPYSFQGLKVEGMRLLLKAGEATGLPVMTEILDASQLPLFKDVDLIEVGSGNVRNYHLLTALGRIKKPVLLRRGPAMTYEEWLMSAEYILAGGNGRVILCESGIRTFENYTKNTFDITSIPVLKALTHLPVAADPCQASGKYSLVPHLASAACAAGADGLVMEVHPDPQHALCEGERQLEFDKFSALAGKLFALHGTVREGEGEDE